MNHVVELNRFCIIHSESLKNTSAATQDQNLI
jgi:hypothetical protein